MFNFDTSGFNKMIEKVLKQGEIDAVAIVKENGQKVIKALVEKTPIDKGFGRAGWYEAWTGLDVGGAPMTSRGGGKTVVNQGKITEATYNAKGTYKEDLKREKGPVITFSNNTTVSTKAGNTRAKIKRLQAEVKGKRGPEAQAVRQEIKDLRTSVKGKRSDFGYLRALNAGTLTGENGEVVGTDKKGFFSDTMKEQKIEFKDHIKNNFQKHSR